MLAITCAMVVLPVPGGPQRITEDNRSASIRTRSGLPGTQEVLLAHDLVERAGPQSRCERSLSNQSILGGRREQILGRGLWRRGYWRHPGGEATARRPRPNRGAQKRPIGVELCHHRLPCGTCSWACSGCGSSGRSASTRIASTGASRVARRTRPRAPARRTPAPRSLGRRSPGLSDIPVIGSAPGRGTRPPSTMDTAPAPPPLRPARPIRRRIRANPTTARRAAPGCSRPPTNPPHPRHAGPATTNTDARTDGGRGSPRYRHAV